MISANSFWILLAEVLNCLALKDLASRSLALRSFEAVVAVVVAELPDVAAAPVEVDPVDEDALTEAIVMWLVFGTKAFIERQVPPLSFEFYYCERLSRIRLTLLAYLSNTADVFK